jgi:hypothetical protein
MRIITAVTLLVGCASAAEPASPGPGQAPSAIAASHTITAYRNGSFSPATLDIQEGDTVTFVGQPGIVGLLPLRTTDAIVQTTQADITAATASGAACMTSTLAYTTTHMLPGDDNELTGPLRRGASGIFALGPESAAGYFEGPAADTCDSIFAAAGSPLVAGETVHEDVVAGAATKLCSKGRGGKKSTTTNSRFVLQSTWDNPDITGAVIRINWAELYAMTVVGGVETYTMDYSKLDTELENAARRGKLVALELLAGDGIPPWIFSDYAPAVDATATGLAAKTVVPIKTSDFGSSGDTGMPTNASCGYAKTMGSPADDAYKTALLTTLRDLAARIRGNAQHYQALANLKVTGLNFLTGEMRLPRRCLDPALPNADNGNSQSTCFCNTRIWATPLGTAVAAYNANASDPAAPTVTGGGYTSQIAQNFMNAVENTIYVELGRRKTMSYMLIQDGFPDVLDATHYAMDSGAVAPNLGYVDATGAAIRFDQQTIDALNGGQLGNFRKVNPDGSPNLAAGGDPDASALFAPMQAALGPIPVDAVTGLDSCLQALPTALVFGKLQGLVATPGTMSTNLNSYSNASSGCPNKWAAREGYEGQIIGYQTKNDLASSDELSAALWNATLNSNAVFVEAYEAVLWRAEQERYLGNAVLSTVAAGYASVVERQKGLGDWTRELHQRRRAIAGFAANALVRHMNDPFPDSYTFTFKKDLAPGAVESYFFINPAGRCASGALSSGRINVTGI